MLHRLNKTANDEKRNEEDEDKERSNEHFMTAYDVECFGGTLPMPERLDRLLDNAKSKHEPGKHKRFPDGGRQQGLVLVLGADVDGISEHDDLGNHDGVEQRRAVGEEGDVKLL